MNKFYLASKKSSLCDSLYRYQIAKPIISVGGKSGNKTTYFENSESFATLIKVSSDYFAKYIGTKISCGVKFDKIKNCQTFRGEYTYNQIISYLNEFISIYILCYACDYPETNLILNNNNICQNCEACGFQSEITLNHMDKTYDLIKKTLLLVKV